jgi:hypothetical protein
MKQVIITVSPKGEVKVQTAGFSGTSCQQATAEFERALGKTTSDAPTEEAYVEQNNAVDQY